MRRYAGASRDREPTSRPPGGSPGDKSMGKGKGYGKRGHQPTESGGKKPDQKGRLKSEIKRNKAMPAVWEDDQTWGTRSRRGRGWWGNRGHFTYDTI